MPGLVFFLLCRLLVEVVRVGVRLARKAKPRPICADCAFAHVQYAANGRCAISCTFGGMVRPMKLDVLYCTDYRDRNRPHAAPIGFVREIANAGNG
jgi:hypothetical protein